MPRTRRHITTSYSANSTEYPHHFADRGTSMRTPQMNAQVEEVGTQINAQVEGVGPQMNAQVQEDGPVHQSTVGRDEPQLFRGSKRTTRTWDVQIRDGNGEVKRQKMRAIDVYSLPPGEKVVVEWNSRNQPVELSGGMLAQFLGHIASNCHNFPIGYEKWQKIPACYKDHVWNNIIKTKLEVNDDGHRRYIFKSLAKKWKDYRCNLYNLMKCDPDGPREANIARKPPEIPLEQWVAFVDYRARADTKAKAEQNTINRTHQTMPHTLGSKSIARLENEMEKQLGRSITRAELFQASHTTSDGSFVNEEARHNHEELIIRSQGSTENEAFTSVFGKEHPGYVRGMGLGVVPTQVYGPSTSSSRRNEASGGTQAEFNELRDTVQLLRQQVQENEQRFQQQIAILAQQLASQNQNIATNQENLGSPNIGRRSSQGSHTAHPHENSNEST